MKHTLRPEQQAAVDYALDTDRNVCFASPTGTGKSLVELYTQQRLGDGAWLLTPSIEIARGMLEKKGVPLPNSEHAVRALAWEHRISTPIVFRNRMRHDLDLAPTAILLDETHHDRAATYDEIRDMAPDARLLGYTATPYRGTPDGTRAFRDFWGDPVWIITLDQAAELGRISVPSFATRPLLDDDTIDVQNGEFVVSSADAAVKSVADDVSYLLSTYYNGLYDKPTMITVNSVEQAKTVANACTTPVHVVVGATTQTQRQQAFADTVSRTHALISIRVVGEGVDLPLRRLVDLAATMSPVKWMQLLGRITRPGGESEYVCCCRNIERHGYLWAGVIPASVVKDAQKSFPAPSSRIAARAVGFERIGRFRPIELPLRDGLVGTMYTFQHVVGVDVYDYAIMLHPASSDVFYARRLRGNAETGWGKWSRVDGIDDLDGGTARSMPGGDATEKQQRWWSRAAKSYGLDGTVAVSKKQFQALPILKDCGVRFV